jgi:hypothetical protein
MAASSRSLYRPDRLAAFSSAATSVGKRCFRALVDGPRFGTFRFTTVGLAACAFEFSLWDMARRAVTFRFPAELRIALLQEPQRPPRLLPARHCPLEPFQAPVSLRPRSRIRVVVIMVRSPQ